MARPDRILIADDEPLTRELLTMFLESWDYEVEAVGDGASALARLLAKDAPQLAIVDWCMPGLSGPQVCRRLRRSALQYCYLILLTGQEIDRLVEGLEAGADDFMRKPVQPEVLKARLEVGRRVIQVRHESRDAKFLQQTLHSLSARLLMLDQNGKVMAQNRPPDLYSCPVFSQGVGSSYLEVCDGHSDFHKLGSGIRSVLEGKSSIYTQTGLRPVGYGSRWFDVRVTCLKGRPGVVVCHEDSTELRKVEAELLESQSELAKVQKMNSLGRMAGGLAHDFNNLLTAIMGHSQLLRQEFGATHTAATDLDEITSACGRAKRLTQQLLTFSRHQLIEPTVLALNEELMELHSSLARLLGTDIQLELDFDSDLGRIRIDRGQLEQIVINLVTNSRDAMPGGGKVFVSTGNVRVEETPVSEVSAGEYVCLAVADSGHGMRPDVAEQMFEPFFTTKQLGKGTGLGLSTVYGIVKQAGGDIKVSTAPGRGTEVRVYFPRIWSQLTAREKVSSPACQQGSGTVLLVEDEAPVRNLVRKILNRLGYSISYEATHGREALDFCQEYEGEIDVVVTDLVMPQMGGREFVELMRPSRPDTKVLYISGFSDRQDELPVGAGSGAALLEKPFGPGELSQKLQELLEV